MEDEFWPVIASGTIVLLALIAGVAYGYGYGIIVFFVGVLVLGLARGFSELCADLVDAIQSALERFRRPR